MYAHNSIFSNELVGHLYNELEHTILELSKSELKIFFSLRDRLNFLFTSKQLSQQTYQAILTWLYKYENEIFLFEEDELEYFLKSARGILAELYFKIDPENIPDDYSNYLDKNQSNIVFEAKTIFSKVRAEIISLQNSFIELSITTDPAQIIKVQTEFLDKELFIQLKKIKNIYQGTIPCFVHGLKQFEEKWMFDELVLFPDFLIDVTSIAECFDNKLNVPIKHFISLFRDRMQSKSILLGTAANEFLDELILDSTQDYPQLMLKVFRKFALGISALNEEDLNDFIYSTRLHFEHLQNLIKNKFEGKILRLDECILEPSFFSVEFGIQGRLDILYDGFPKKIIELKSGKPFNPNSEGISASHHAQAILYKMLLESVYGSDQQNEAWILYSGLSKHQLREAIDQKSIRKKLISIRNSILLIHMHMSMISPVDRSIFDMINIELFEALNPFSRRDGIKWLEIYSSLNAVEKDFIKQYSYFNSRELLISKCGLHGTNKVNGLASMWLQSKLEKISQFALLADLTIVQIDNNIHDAPIVILQSPAAIDRISQFRIGDTLVMYPDSTDGKGMLNNMVYKCTLIHSDNGRFHIRLRGRQFFWKVGKLQKWCLESDNLDRSFLYQYSGLFEFASSSSSYRSLILGCRSPNSEESVTQTTPWSMENIVRQSILAKEYFLLWGPPGSGKTSVYIRKLVKSLMDETAQNILLLAYTNRAVDEICEVLKSISKDLPFLRIGSRFGTRPDFHDHLLDSKINQLSNKKELLNLLNSVRIITATISSIHGKRELFELKQFDIVIIDEASQILEPNLVGLLSRFKKFILIGDHLQLPAVSSQDPIQSRIVSEALNLIGFRNCGESFFERLFRQCVQNNWKHAFNMLNKQGRMHDEIMQFPSAFFYNNSLKLVNEDRESIQKIALVNKFSVSEINFIDTVLKTERKIFIDVEPIQESLHSKNNQAEANIVSYIIRKLKALYDFNSIKWDQNTCGIISPFRVQISTIQNTLNSNGLNNIPLTIDTVERYQGSARDIIIISCCVKSKSQLEQISSLNEDQQDRKLNVALTRAKEQIILIGNKKILCQSQLYSELINTYFQISSDAELTV